VRGVGRGGRGRGDARRLYERIALCLVVVALALTSLGKRP